MSDTEFKRYTITVDELTAHDVYESILIHLECLENDPDADKAVIKSLERTLLDIEEVLEDLD